jgi:hypothetical protein
VAGYADPMRPLPLVARTANDVGLALWLAASVRTPRDGGGTPSPATVAMAAHMLGAAYVTWDNRARLVGQRGVAPVAAVKGLMSLVAAVLTVLADLRARTGRDRVPLDRAAAGLVGATLISNSVLGEQQRPREVVRGLRVPGALSRSGG